MKKRIYLLALIFLYNFVPCYAAESGLTFTISFPEEHYPNALDGRMLLLISNNEKEEPRFQIVDGPETQCAFGIDVEGLEPGDKALFNADVFGYPVRSLTQLKPGEYWVQGLLHIYETFFRADGHVVKLPMDRGEGQQWNKAPGNLFSTPKKVIIDPKKINTMNE